MRMEWDVFPVGVSSFFSALYPDHAFTSYTGFLRLSDMVATVAGFCTQHQTIVASLSILD